MSNMLTPNATAINAGKLHTVVLSPIRLYTRTHCWTRMPENTPVRRAPATTSGVKSF